MPPFARRSKVGGRGEPPTVGKTSGIDVQALGLGVCGLVYAGWYTAQAWSLLRHGPWYQSPGLFPTLVGVSLLLLFGLFGARGLLRGRVRGKGMPVATSGSEEVLARGAAVGGKGPALFTALSGVYVLLMPVFGFLLVTPLYTLTVLWLCGIERRWGWALAWGGGVSLALYGLFHLVFRVPLPGIGG